MLATGGLVDTGKPVAMPQGHKKPSTPVTIDRLSGTFKKGGSVKRYNEGGLNSQTNQEQKGYESWKANERAENKEMSEAMNPMNWIRGLRDKLKGKGAVTTTETQVSKTVTPPQKKRGGSVKC